MTKAYVPEAGDIVWINFSPQSGREQAGHRPALVLSPSRYNGKTSLMLACPITTQIKGYPFEVLLSGDPESVVLSDHIRLIDWKARKAKKKGKVAQNELEEVRAKILPLMGG